MIRTLMFHYNYHIEWTVPPGFDFNSQYHHYFTRLLSDRSLRVASLDVNSRSPCTPIVYYLYGYLRACSLLTSLRPAKSYVFNSHVQIE